METNAKITPVTAAIAPSTASSGSGDFQQSRASEEAERAARYRLVIEEGSNPGSFIYKTLDSVTGEIIRQLPREEVVRMATADQYDAGALIDTSA